MGGGKSKDREICRYSSSVSGIRKRATINDGAYCKSGKELRMKMNIGKTKVMRTGKE